MAEHVAATGSRRTQRERRDETRARLLDATIGSVAAHDYTATTTRRVAELAGVATGALAHQFPTRLELIATTIDEVGRRLVDELRAEVAATPSGTQHTGAVLDLLWTAFRSDLFTVWLRVWLAAAEDPDLYAALAPVDDRMSAAIAAVVADLAPDRLASTAWRQRINTALHTLRGLALAESLLPRAHASKRDPGPTLEPSSVRSSTADRLAVLRGRASGMDTGQWSSSTHSSREGDAP